MSFAQDRKLLPKRQVFQEQIPARAKESGGRNEQKLQKGNMPSVCTRTGKIERTTYLHNSRADRDFGEGPVKRLTNTLARASS